MPISVLCPSCYSRFQVSEKYAGQTGPCPKCKQPIKIPAKSEEVVVHAPEEFGPKDASGRAVLKPIEREETQVSTVMIVGIVVSVLACLVLAFFIGRTYSGSPDGVPMLFLAIGAAVLGPPIAAGSYGLFRDAELEPYRGGALLVRSLVCGLIYAALWGVYWFVKTNVLGGEIEMFHLVFIAPALIAAGGGVPTVSLDLDYTNGMLHYGVYLVTTGLLRLLMGMPVY